jgi:hypothetical protein
MTKELRKLGVAVAMAVLAVPGMAWAGSGDYAVGGAENTNGFFQIAFSAHSGPLGEDPTGYVRARSRPQGGFPSPFRFGGEVTCLRVDGNRAAIKYRFDHADNPLLVGGGVEIFAEDNGSPRGGEPVDGGAFRTPLPPAAFELSQPSVCDDPNTALYSRIDSGNAVVHDE